MSNLKLSVLVICYNQEQYIAQTIESIVSQEHNYSYELIICDDASKDKTPEIIKSYYEKYPDIIKMVLREKNLGLIGNYYDGLSRLTGEYIMVCAGDDYWLPGKVETQITYMDEHPDVGLCYGDAITVDTNGNQIGVKKGQINNTFKTLITSNYMMAASICQRKCMADIYINQISPLQKNWLMEDYPLVLWFSINSKISYISQQFTAYRLLEESACHFTNLEYAIKFCESIRKIREYFLLMNSGNEKESCMISYRFLFIEMIHMTRFVGNIKYKEYCKKILKECNYNYLKNLYLSARISNKNINKIHIFSKRALDKALHSFNNIFITKY